MRFWLLLLVAHLPTTRKRWEEMLPVGPGQESLASLSLDNYTRSTYQLVQPTSELNEATVRALPSRPHWLAQASKKSYLTGSLQVTTTCFSSQHPPLPGASIANPPDWLFGQSQERQTRWRDLPRRTGPSVEPWGPHRQMNSSKVLGRPRRKLHDPRAPGHYLVRPLRDWNEGSQTSWQPLQATASPQQCSQNSLFATPSYP